MRSAFFLALALCACASSAAEPGSEEQASTAQANAIALRLAVSTVECSGGDCTAGTVQHTHFSFRLQNLAFDKKVAVEATNPDGTTDILRAHFERTAGSGQEIWAVDHDYSSFAGDAPRDLSFQAIYGENGKLHVDDNGGRGYTVGQNAWVMLAGQNILLERATFDPSRSEADFGLYVRNLAFTKDIAIVYTTDHWATTQTASAHYTGSTLSFGGPPVANPNAFGVERWLATARVSSGPIEFAIAYKVNGVTHWDNNFGKNYVLGANGTLAN